MSFTFNIRKMKKFQFFFTLIISNILLAEPTLAQNTHVSFYTNYTNDGFFENQHKDQSFKEKNVGLNLGLNKNKFNSSINVDYNNEGNIKLDGSYLSYTTGITSIGFGAINRNWSFSPNTSLILSKNARPSKGVFLILKNGKGFNADFLSWLGPWEIEVFSNIISSQENPKNTILTGIRTVVEPSKKLKIEFLKTAQWAGDGHSNKLSNLQYILIGDTNDGSGSNINQMAGFGFDYKISKNQNTPSVYAQIVGEDKAGNLPSCLIYLAGIKFNNFSKKPYMFGLEIIDTRINHTTNGWCGPNTAYNNNIYKYTNYGVSMGAPIDSEGKSLEVFGATQISNTTNLNYSIKKLLLNDSSWAGHRLSSNRQIGYVQKISAIWERNKAALTATIYNKDLNLNKSNVTKSLGFSISGRFNF
jgi:hypothetical protein